MNFPSKEEQKTEELRSVDPQVFIVADPLFFYLLIVSYYTTTIDTQLIP